MEIRDPDWTKTPDSIPFYSSTFEAEKVEGT